MTSAIIGAALALIGFVITQSVLRFVIEPIQEQRKLIGEVAHALVLYGNAYIDTGMEEYPGKKGPDEHREYVLEAKKALRVLAGRLRSSLWSIPFYRGFAWLRLVPRGSDVVAASMALIGWSNVLISNDAVRRSNHFRDRITEKLGIEL